MDKARILEECVFYREAAVALRARILEAATYAALPPGHVFFGEGETCRYLGFLGAGTIRVFKTAESGREMTLYRVQGGELCVVNLLSILLGRPVVASAVVESPAEVVVFDGGIFRSWLDGHSVVRDFVFEAMSRRLLDVMTHVEEIAFARMDCRVAGLLLREFSGGREITVTHEELAAELGTAREVVSRTLKDFERTGAISMARSRLQLRDAASLRRIADQS